MDVLLDAQGYQARQRHQEDASTSSTDAHKELLADDFVMLATAVGTGEWPLVVLMRAQMNRVAGASPTSGSPEGRGAGVLGLRRFYRRPDVDVLAACCWYEDLL